MASKFSLRKDRAFGDGDLPAMPVGKKSSTVKPLSAPEEILQPSNAPSFPRALGGPKDFTSSSSTSFMSAEVATDVEIVRLNVSQLRVWKGNPRHVIDAELLDQLIDDIRENGQHHPVDVIPDPDTEGHYLIIGGQRRWLAISTGNINEGRILARIRTDLVSEDQILSAALTPQLHTSPLKDIDLAISLAQNESGVRAISRATGRNAGELSKLKQIGDLPESIISIFKAAADKFSRSFGYEVVLVNNKCGLDVALEFAREIKARDLSIKKTVTRREELTSDNEGGAPTDKKPAKRHAWSALQYPKYQGALKMRESTGEVALSLKGLDPDQIKAVKNVVEEILKE